MPVRALATALAALALVAPTAAASAGEAEHTPIPEHTLIQLNGRSAARALPALELAGGRRISARPPIWRLPARGAQGVLPGLRRAGLVRHAVPDRRFGVPLDRTPASDPLLPQEWWLAAVGADQVDSPGPGKPVTVIDSGIDLSQPEFSGRPDTKPINPQSTQGEGEFHGTAVSSLVAAPANGLGIVGVYPRAALRVWDASPNGDFEESELIDGILTAAHQGPGVINLSIGGQETDKVLDSVIASAFGAGSLVVAAAGNDGESGSPTTYPAALPHVLTVAATDVDGGPASFSSRSLGIDLAAPGVRLPVAVPFAFSESGYRAGSGTSYAAPIVSGAAAWIWTERPTLDNTQLFDLLRSSASDISPVGFDTATGFGMLNIPAALEATPPATDPQEPNDDVDSVKPGLLFSKGSQPLTSPARLKARLTARLDTTEDPHDVYRIFVPSRRSVVVSVQGKRNVDLTIWGPRTSTVAERGAARTRDLVGRSARSGTAQDAVRVTNKTARGVLVYADATLGTRTLNGTYTLTVSPAASR